MCKVFRQLLLQNISGKRNYKKQQQRPIEEGIYTGMSQSIYSDYNLNNSNNDQARNEFENKNRNFLKSNDRMKPLLSISAPNYPIYVKQESFLDHRNSFTEVPQSYHNFGGGNEQKQSSSNNIGQFGLPITGQPNGFGVRLPIGQTSNGLSNTVSG